MCRLLYLVEQSERDASVLDGVVGLSLNVDVEKVLSQEPQGYLPLPGKRPQVHRVDDLTKMETDSARAC